MEGNFSNRVQDVIRLSREEALRLGHDYIGTEHLLLGIIREEVDRLDRFLGDFLAYGRPGALDAAPLDLAALARETAEAVRLRPGSPAVAVEGGGPAPIEGDRGRLRQVVLNLLLNAAEAAGPAGRVEVRVEGGPEGAVLSVADDGPGIPADVLPRLFRPFFTTRKGGTGLGLAISARIVDLHGGRISAGNRDGGRGAEFVVRLPPRPPPAPPAPSGGRPREPAPHP